jgi:DNA-binding IclR family transcriptional regulator
VRRDHPDTSHAAAERILDAQPNLRRRVFNYIQSQQEWGATDEEVQRALGMNPSTERPRRVELVELGLVADSGSRRRTESGRAAVVWRTRR